MNSAFDFLYVPDVIRSSIVEKAHFIFIYLFIICVMSGMVVMVVSIYVVLLGWRENCNNNNNNPSKNSANIILKSVPKFHSKFFTETIFDNKRICPKINCD